MGLEDAMMTIDGAWLLRCGLTTRSVISREMDEDVPGCGRKRGFSCTMESSDDENNGALENYVAKERRHTFPSNDVKFVDDVFSGQSGSCLENFRMDKHVFYKLCDILQARGLLRHTNRIKIEEQLAIFMFIIGHNLRTRAVQELFKYSGKYYLVDNECANIPGFIAPYSDVPYDSLNSGGGFHPQDAKELFNHRHSMLHNATLRTFEALKARFPILTSAPPYPMSTQVKLVVAACALHNYIRGETPDDWIFRMYEQETGLPLENSMPPLETEAPFTSAKEQTLDIPFKTEELERTLQLRDSIATAIWNDYIRDFSV
ncbi:hypothetical protein RJ639_018742 [Escallonia herrerae]|uniref:DUF8040 domain-containing protein n=1 Tax=Escallonia herrerae TaxID=1293975 RepID=A0AA89AI59_9ASTE|nr:hypothetical protein RJ639_018742 [Escallonia herrerae]